jgi:hypothetical protein
MRVIGDFIAALEVLIDNPAAMGNQVYFWIVEKWQDRPDLFMLPDVVLVAIKDDVTRCSLECAVEIFEYPNVPPIADDSDRKCSGFSERFKNRDCLVV